MKVLFIGCVEFSKNALEKLINLKSDVVGVITKKHSSFNADFVNLSKTAKKANIPYHYTNDANSIETVTWIEEKKPDIIFCLGWSQLLKKNILSVPPKGVVGYHPSRLPNNRGRHPLIWAMVLGLKETASTFFIMDVGADTGDIISQETFPIHYEDKAGAVYERMTQIALQQLELIISQLESNDINRIPQNDEGGNSWRKRRKKDGKIDFRMPSKNIYNLVRALDKPYPGAHFEYRGEDIKVWETKVADFSEHNLEPGKILDIDNGKILVKTGTGAIWLEKHEMKELPKIDDYLNYG